MGKLHKQYIDFLLHIGLAIMLYDSGSRSFTLSPNYFEHTQAQVRPKLKLIVYVQTQLIIYNGLGAQLQASLYKISKYNIKF